MNSYQAMVRQFHHGAQLTIGDFPSLRDAELRAALIKEEADETCKALIEGDEVGTIDGICDLIYVALGTAVAMGIDLDPFFHEVHFTNMQKLDGPKREDGKQLKPEGWKPPDIEGLLRKQRTYPLSEAEARHERLNWGQQ